MTPEERKTKARGPRGRIDGKLDSLRVALRSSIWTRGLSLLAVALAVLACLSFGIDRAFRLSVTGRSIALVLYLGALAWVGWKALIRPALVVLSDSVLADILEARFPDLRDSLRSAVSFLAEAPAQDKGKELTAVLKREVTKDAAKKVDKLDLSEVIDTKRVSETAVFALCAACLLGVVAHYAGDSFGIWMRRQLLLEETDYEYEAQLQLIGLRDGEYAVPHGETLRIVAETVPGKKTPALVSIRFDYGAGESRQYMERSGGKDGPGRFEYEHPSVTEEFSFHLKEEGRGFFSNYHSPRYTVKVLERPQVSELVITSKAPAYTGLGSVETRGDIGELAVPIGSELIVNGLSTKALERAVLVVEGRELTLKPSPDAPHSFTGSWTPKLGGTCLIRLEDTEQVPPERPFQFSIHMVEDNPPVVQASTKGIGQMITAEARIPILLKARDDYGIDSTLLRWTLQDAEGSENSETEVLKLPGVPARKPLEAETSWDITRLKIKPEKRLNLQIGASDNNAISGSKTGYSGIMSFLVVTSEKLGEEFLRRELEQRKILERLIEEERRIRDQVFSMVAGTWNKPGEISPEDLRKIEEISRSERQHGRHLRSIASAIEHILMEMENNRVGEADDLKRLATLIIDPLRNLAGVALPQIIEKFSLIRELTGKEARVAAGTELGHSIEAKIQELETILIQMQRLEGFTEIVKHLRAIIRTQSESSTATRQDYRRLIEDIFEDDLFEEDKGEENK